MRRFDGSLSSLFWFFSGEQSFNSSVLSSSGSSNSISAGSGNKSKKSKAAANNSQKTRPKAKASRYFLHPSGQDPALVSDFNATLILLHSGSCSVDLF